MLLKGNTVLENIDEGNLSRELEIAKFQNYGREKFSELIKHEISFYDFIQHSSKFYSIELPKEISDYFLRIDIAPYFWLSEAPLVSRIEKLLSTKSEDFNFVSNHREVKNYYLKWLNQKVQKQKQYFAVRIVNLVERNFAFQNFYNVILYGIILTYDINLYNPKRAIKLFDRATEIVNGCNISDQIQNELLYYINLFKGYVYIKEYEFLNSQQTFKTALNYNSYSITASFYSALSARYLDDFDLAYDYLKELLLTDKLRFQYAINYNNLSLFTFFFESATFYNVFTEPGFAQMFPDIDFLIRSLYSGESNSMQFTYGKLINLDNLRNKEFFNDSVYMEIEFLNKALEHYRQRKNGLIRIVEQIFRDKLITLVEYIRNLIETHYFDLIKDEMDIFDKQIKQNKRQLSIIEQEKEDASKKIKMNQEKASEYLEQTLTEKSEFIENKIKHLDKNPKFNITNVFYSSMLFTVVISIVIFIIVGFTSSIFGSSNVNSAKYFVMEGIKWGGVTFILGIFISIFTSLSTSWESSAESKKLAKKLSYVKETEAQEREMLKEDSERREKVYHQKFEERIKSQKKIIEDFEQEREHNYLHKYNLARQEMEQYITPLNKILNSLQNDG